MTGLVSPCEACSVFVECSRVKCLLEDEHFSLTGFKVMHSSELSGLIGCSRLRYNGRLKLVYHSGDMQPLSATIKTIDAQRLLPVLKDAADTALNVKSSGFLQCGNLVIGPDSLFMDAENGKAGLIYLPVSAADAESSASAFQDRLKELAEYIGEQRPELAEGAIGALSRKLAGGLTLEETAEFLGLLASSDTENGQPCIEIRALNAPYALSLRVNRPEYVIGKSVMGVDGTIGFNSAISRVHCKISLVDGAFYVTDLGSVNGTYVNHIRVTDANALPLRDGDILTLANSDFAVTACGHGGERA